MEIASAQCWNYGLYIYYVTNVHRGLGEEGTKGILGSCPGLGIVFE